MQQAILSRAICSKVGVICGGGWVCKLKKGGVSAKAAQGNLHPCLEVWERRQHDVSPSVVTEKSQVGQRQYTQSE